MTESFVPGEGVAGLLRRASESWPDRVYLRCPAPPFEEAATWTFAEMDRRSDNMAAILPGLGLPSGSVAAVCAQNSASWITLEWALLKAGVVMATLDPRFTDAELRDTISQAGASGLFTDRSADSLGIDIPVHPVEAALPTASSQTPPERRSFLPDSPAMIQFTSGSTGFPKGAVLSHRGLSANAITSQHHWSIREGDRVAHGFPLFHIAGSGTLTLGPAAVGAETIPLPVFSARGAAHVLRSEACTHFFGTPTMLAALLAAVGTDSEFLELRIVGVGGAPLPAELADRAREILDVEVIDIFGQTETTGSFLAAGRPIEGVTVTVVDAAGAEVRAGEPGELCYEGPGRMLAYVDGAPAPIDELGRLRTGDMAVVDEAGRVKVVGRLRDVINRGGENLHPAEIEARLLEHPDVLDAAVVGLPDEHYGEIVWACVVPEPETSGVESDLLAWCAATLTTSKVPAGVTMINEIHGMNDFPRTASGKVRKGDLREKLISPGRPDSRS